MAYISKQQFVDLFKTAPPGTSPSQAAAALIKKGNTLEGLNDSPDTSANPLPVSTPQTQTQEPSFWKKAASFVFGGTPALAPIKAPEVTKGMVKSYATTAGQVLQIPTEVAEAITGQKMPTTKLSPSAIGQELVKQGVPSNTSQQVGYILGNISQFFLPGGAEKAAIGKLDEAIDAAKITSRFGEAAVPYIKTALKSIGSGLVTGASTAGVQALQTGGQGVAGAGIAGLLAGTGGKLLESVAPTISKILAQSDFRLSPTQASRFSTKIDGAAEFLSKNKVVGTSGMQYNKVQKITSQMEDAVQASVPKDITVSRADIENGLKQIPEQFRDKPAIYNKVKNDVDTAIETLNSTQPDKISLQSLMSQKRSYAGAAFSKDGSKMISSSKFGISNVFYDALGNAMNESNSVVKIPKDLSKYFGGATEMSLKDFNKTYSNAVSASQLLDISRNKADANLFTRVLTTFLGRAAFAPLGPLGEAAGAAGGYEAAARGITLGKSLVGAGLQSAGSTIPSTVKVGLGAISNGGGLQE